MSTSLWLSMTKIKGLGPKSLINLYKLDPNLSFNSLLNLNKESLLTSLKNTNIVNSLQDKEYLKKLILESDHEIKKYKEQNIEVISITDSRYPLKLREIEDPPAILYCRGNLDALNIQKKIAVIGTRKATSKGRNAAAKIASAFVGMNYAIVSGLAEGIDSAGHRGALEAKGITIAILPGGVDQNSVYPAKNRALAEEIVANNGLLVSEYAPGKRPFKASFVQRDRLQSGMSLGVCPVQTDIKGGTQHTIKFSKEQKRILFCPVPSEKGYENITVYNGISKMISDNSAIVLNDKEDYVKLDNLMSTLLKEEKLIDNETESEQVDLFNQSNLAMDDYDKNSIEVAISDLCYYAKKLGLSINEVFDLIKNKW
ncbi:DNA-protecting protein DprA [Halobacillus salinarum]|uniref:DNA-protecting protein DprA n=1 Tax=Halobacillus salinarum TaxID=2932257 RepID=A0ABY4EMQ4_9BACI|nr:DNA-processing protein DprA [Halobacillus salinarum]UOQ43391.1 DNA-protecting protein DprA [Halobacillus salinarum]